MPPEQAALGGESRQHHSTLTESTPPELGPSLGGLDRDGVKQRGGRYAASGVDASAAGALQRPVRAARRQADRDRIKQAARALLTGS